MKFFYASFFSLILPVAVFAQEYQLNWGEVPNADRIMDTFPADTLADAVVLGETGQLFFRNGNTGYDYQLNVHRRVKLLKRTSFDSQGQVSLPLYHHDDTEHLLELEAQTISPNGKITPVNRKDFFYEKKNEYWTYVNFTFPLLEEGAVIEYRYTLQSKDVVQPRTWYFMSDIPVRFSQLNLHNSSHLSFVTLFEGAEYMEVVSKEKDEVRMRKGNTRFLYSNDLYIIENAPALREEAYMTNIDDYNIRLRFQLSEINRTDGTKRPFLSTWEQSAKDLINGSYFGALYLQKKAYRKLQETLESQVSLPSDPEQQMRSIYRFLVDRVQWDGGFGFQPHRDLFEAFETGKGTAAELNFMLLALLNAKGITAHPVLTSTREHGRMTQQYPIMDQFNYVMALVSIGGHSWLLDATHRLRPPGMPGIHALNKRAWVVNPEWPQWIRLEVPISKDLFAADMTLNADGSVTGKLKATYSVYSAWQERQSYESDPSGRFWQKRLQGFHVDAVLDSVSFQKADDLEGSFSTLVFFTVPSVGTAGGDFLYLRPAIYANFTENPFKQEDRSFPVDFPYPFEEEWRMLWRLSPDLKPVELPENINTSLPNDQGIFSYECKEIGGLIYVNSRLRMQQDLIPPENYVQLKALFDQYVQQQDALIVLKKQ